MNVAILSLEAGAKESTGCVVIIDVLRAFTTAAVAFQGGASQIVLASSVSDALELKARGVGAMCIGERNGIRPAGFQLGNSPAAMRSADVHGKTLIQTTTNGTAGILAARQAQYIFAASFVCAEATVAAIRSLTPDRVSVVAMGRQGARADEDELCALYIRSRLEGRQPDMAALSTTASTMVRQPPRELVDKGEYHEQDRAIAFSLGTIPIAMQAAQSEGRITLKPVSVSTEQGPFNDQV